LEKQGKTPQIFLFKKNRKKGGKKAIKKGKKILNSSS
jgi:hypothetical protein